MKRIVSFLSILGLLASACATTGQPCKCPKPRQPVPVVIEENDLDLEKIFESVVQIKVKVDERMSEGKLEESYEYGTGFFINDRGLILTSAHVMALVDDARNVTVFHGGRALQARPLKTYRDVDLATLMVDAGRTIALQPAPAKARLGQKVYAIGFPYVDVFTDRAPAVSVGHVAGTDRSIVYEKRAVERLLLTDAFVANGCSGGPLIDEQGRVLGILRFNLSKDGSWLGLSFAEPISSYPEKTGAKR